MVDKPETTEAISATVNTTLVITKRCPLCRTALIWNEENQWWDCPKCGNIVIP